MSDFVSQLAQMIQAARPQPMGVQSRVQHLGPLKSKETVGPDLVGSGMAIEHLGNVLLENRGREQKDAEEFYNQVSQFQEGDKEFWDKIKREPRIQERLTRFAKARPELFHEAEPGVWDAAPSIKTRQDILGKQGDIDYKGALKANVEQSTRRGVALQPHEVRKEAASATKEEWDAQLAGMTLPDQVKFLKERITNLRAETQGRQASTQTENALRGGRQALLGAQVETERQQPALMQSQTEQNRVQSRNMEAMLPYEQRYKDAAARNMLAEAEARAASVYEDTLKLKMSARNTSVKELLDVRANADKALTDVIKTRAGVIDPYEEATEHVRATKAMISGFGPTTMVTGIDDKGQEVTANVPGAIEDAAGRYWVWSSLEKVYDAFETLWQQGDEESLQKAKKLMLDGYKMYQSTYGQVKDPKVLEMLNPMPDVTGYSGDVPTVNDLFSKMLTMILTADSLEEPLSPDKLPVNDPIHQIADKLGIQPLPPTKGSWWGTKQKTYPRAGGAEK